MRVTRACVELFCGAGLATRGIMRAGFREVYAFDIKPQPRQVAHKFQQIDVTDPRERAWLLLLAREAGFVWASPPCQFGTELRHAPGTKKDHLNLIPWARGFIEEAGVPGVIENVEGAREHLRDPLMLCGRMFNLGTYLSVGREDPEWFTLERHRYFECIGFRKPRQPRCDHGTFGVIGVYGAHARVRAASKGGRGTAWPFNQGQNFAAAAALGVQDEGLTLAEMSEGIPPAYSAYILNSFKRQRTA